MVAPRYGSLVEVGGVVGGALGHRMLEMAANGPTVQNLLPASLYELKVTPPVGLVSWITRPIASKVSMVAPR
jgi:hypothetical protein